MSAREIVDGLAERGYLNPRTNFLNDPTGAWWWLHGEGYSAAEAAAAIGLQVTAVWQFGADNGLPALTGYTGKRRTAAPGAGSAYGSGHEGTQAPAAPPAQPYDQTPIVEPVKLTPEQALRRHMAEFGLRMPDHALSVKFEAQRLGIPLADVEAMFGLEPGSVWPAGS